MRNMSEGEPPRTSTSEHGKKRATRAKGVSIDTNELRLKSLSDFSFKAELYVVSLTFSLLALSIQFPVESAEVLALRLQAAGWGFLLVSAIAGIKMLRHVSSEYGLELAKSRFEKNDEILEKVGQHARDLILENFDAWVLEARDLRTQLFSIQGYFFVAGLFSLVVARISTYPIF